MVKTITFSYILTVLLTYFLATVIISAIKEETVISLKSKNTKKLVRGVDHTQHIKTRKLSQLSKKLNCPVPFSVKKIVPFLLQHFHRHQLAKTHYIQKIKLILLQLSIKKVTSDDEVPGYLEYITKFQKVHSFDFLIYD